MEKSLLIKFGWKIMYPILKKLVQKSESEIDDQIVESINKIMG